MLNDPDFNQLFSEVFRKKDYRLRLWISKAEFQLRLRTKNLIVRYHTGEDIIQEIVTGLLCGRIHWDQEQVPNLNTFMHNQIRSHISNLLRKEKCTLILSRSLSARLPVYPRYVDADNTEAESLEDILMQMDLKELKPLLLERLKDDIIAYFVFEEITGGSLNHEIAGTLGIKISEVVNAKKRIRTLLKKIYSE
jgi:DNA-directed RNA polymerase specialized sigma24 family protein